MQWYYGKGNELGGPIENDDLVALVKAGQIRPETPVWASYLGNWTPAGRIDGLFVAAGVSLSPELATVSAPVSHGSVPVPGVSSADVGPVAAEVPVSQSMPVGGGASQVATANPIPKIATEKLGLTAVPRREPVGGADQAGSAPDGSGAAGSATAEVSLPDAAVGRHPVGAPVEMKPQGDPGGNGAVHPVQPAQTGAAVLNPNGIPVPSQVQPPAQDSTKPETSRMNGTFTEGGIPEPVDEGFKLLKPSSGGSKSATSEFAPVRNSGPSLGGGWKKWVVPGLASLVLLAGGAALADKFVLGGKLFGLGARPTGPYRYYPSAPKFAVNVEVRGLLLNPVVAGKLESGGGMSMIDQMMHSAVGLRPYDIEDVKFVGTELAMDTPSFVCIITTTKKIPEELLVEKFFGDEKPKKVGGCNLYKLPMMGMGRVVAGIADDNTFLLGGREEIEAVLTRSEDPEFSERELNMLAAATDSPAILSLCFDGEMVSQLAKLQDSLPGGAGNQGNIYKKEFMAGVQSLSMSMDVTEDFEVGYRIEYETEAQAEAAVVAIKQEFEGLGEREFAAQMMAGAPGAEMIDMRSIRKIMEAVEFTQDGTTAVLKMGIPIGFFEELVGKSMGAAAPL